MLVVRSGSLLEGAWKRGRRVSEDRSRTIYPLGKGKLE